jgi:GAF domain-containing protein
MRTVLHEGLPMRFEDERRLHLLATELTDVATLHDIDFVLRDTATMVLFASRVRLWIVDQGLVRLVDRHHERTLPLADPNSLVTQVLASKRPQWSPQCNLQGNTGDSVRAACIVPLMQGDVVLGALALAFPTEHYFAVAERDLLIHVADQVAAAVQRVRPSRWPKASSQLEILASPREVLIVDDDAYDAASLRDLVGAFDYQPMVAFNAMAALRIAEQVVAPIAFVSLGMSTGDGFQIARQLRDMPEWSSTRIVAIGTSERARNRARAATYDEMIVKPLDADVVRVQLQNTNG